MAKRPTLIDITAGYGSNTQHNANNDEIETAFDNTLSRDGSSPNSMEADLDMNGNDLLNVGAVNGGGLEAAVSRGLIEEYLVDTRTQLTSKSIDDSVGSLRTSGYHDIGDGGGALYQRVDNDPSHNLKVQSADGAWWELVPDPWGISVKQAGAVGDNSTDDYQAFIDAINGVADLDSNGTDKATHRVIVPGSEDQYFIGSTIELKRVVHIVGGGGGSVSYPNPSILRFPSQTTGIITHTSGTTGATTEGTPSGGADSTTIENLEIQGGGGTIAGVTDGTKGHGVWMRVKARLVNVYVHGFAGNGVHTVAAVGGSGGIPEGNVNQFYMERVSSYGNHQNGFYVEGADANAGVAILCDGSLNGRAGIQDHSFLGNTWIAPHVSGNGGELRGENAAGESSFVDFGGVKYIANRTATELELVNTQPGTDKTVWIPVGSGSANVTWQSGQSEGTYFVGGGIICSAGNSYFAGVYFETGQAFPQVAGMITSGQHIANYDPGGVSMRFNEWSGAFTWGNLDTFPETDLDKELTLGFWQDKHHPIKVLADSDSALGISLAAWDDAAGRWQFIHGNEVWMYVTSDLTTSTYGRASAFASGHPVFERGIVLGSFANARHMTNGTAAPTTGEHARGEIVWNAEPSAGGKAGWICVSGGTPGTWKQFGAIDA